MIEYGITTSKAHYWCHVCPLDAMFYVYSRREMLERLPGLQEKAIRSAIGRLVPIIKAGDWLRCNGGIIDQFDAGYEFFGRWQWATAASDRAVGAMAEEAFQAACREHLLCLPIRARRLNAKADQVTGRDYECDLGAPSVSVEVKGDIKGGAWGTGNLFVQTHEGTHRDGDRHDFNGRNAHRHEAT